MTTFNNYRTIRGSRGFFLFTVFAFTKVHILLLRFVSNLSFLIIEAEMQTAVFWLSKRKTQINDISHTLPAHADCLDLPESFCPFFSIFHERS